VLSAQGRAEIRRGGRIFCFGAAKGLLLPTSSSKLLGEEAISTDLYVGARFIAPVPSAHSFSGPPREVPHVAARALPRAPDPARDPRPP